MPRRGLQLFTKPFLCFALRTHVLCEAAEIGRRLTALAELCFNAETAVPPEVMTQLLTSYARFEIETADRLRALTGRRSRAAAEAAMAIEAAVRASLRDAIFLCDHQIAAAPIQDTCERLGLRIDLQGFGIAFVPEPAVQAHLKTGALIQVLDDCCQPFDGFHLYYPSRRQQSPAFEIVVNALRFRGVS